MNYYHYDKLCLIKYIYTLYFLKLHPFYFYNTFISCASISIIFGSNMPEKICNRTYIYFASHRFYVLLIFLVKQAASLTNVHSLS